MRDHAKAAFLQHTKWDTARHIPLKADASARRYHRLVSQRTAILMDADPQRGEDTEQFVRVAEFLRDAGLRVPQIFEADHTQGFLIIEDFGDTLLSDRISQKPDQKQDLYREVIDVLIALGRCDVPDWIAPSNIDRLTRMVDPAFEYFVKDEEHKRAIRTCLSDVLSGPLETAQTVSLRDVHAENIMILEGRGGLESIGLLDFQDAFACHPAYDVMSLLQDVRRPFDPQFEAEMMRYFQAHSAIDGFEDGYFALGFLRNFRILGRFQELADLGKTEYVQFTPRVVQILRHNLDHTSLAPMRPLIDPILRELA